MSYKIHITRYILRSIISYLLKSLNFKFLNLFLLSPFFLFSQQIIIDIDENAQNRIMAAPIQSCDFYTGLNLNHLPVIEEEKQIPAFGLYNNHWDTLYIRSNKIEIPFFDNQIKIHLVQEWNSPFAFPISNIMTTSYVKYKGRQHAGVDFAIYKNEPVVACFDGVVRITKKYAEYGNTVVIRHYNGLETLYAMLDNVYVRTGQPVKAGELIGYISNANDNKREVLHFETRFLNEFFNPEKLIQFSNRKLNSNLLVLTPNDFIPVQVILPQQNTEDTNQPLFHIVTKGETIFKICTKYNITEQQLRLLNNLKGDHIELGQKLRIQ